MSEFIAEARILVRPDTTRFRAQLQEEVRRAISQTQIPALTIPIALGAAGAGLAGVTAGASGLASAQNVAAESSLGLASAEKVLNTELARSVPILRASTTATDQKAGADAVAAGAARGHAVAEAQVGKAVIANTAGMLGLRGAVLTAGGAFIAATVGLQALGKAVGSVISFERELNVFAVTSGATADQMERVQEVARELGRDITLPGVAANDAAQALSLLARAGLSVNESLDAVRGTLQLATAAQIDNAQAAELVANALNSFKLDGTEATRVADLLAGAANESQGSITDMGLALKQTAAIASGLGISIEDTITILTQLSRAGLSASDAGTSFRQTLLRLIQDLPRVRREVDRLGLDLRDVNGNIRPQIFEELGRKLKTLTPAARQLAIANLGGADAIRTLLTLTRAAAGEFDNVQDSITRAGLAQEFAAAQTQGLGGDIEAAKNEFADLGLTVGKVASGPLSLFVRTAGATAGAVNDVTAALERTGGGQGFFSAFGDVIDGLQDSFAKMNISFQTGVRLAAIGGRNFSVFGRIVSGVTTAVDDLTAALQRAGREAVAGQGLPQDEGLGVTQILNRVKGFDAEEVRARISGDNNALLAVLEQEREFLLSQLERQFVRNRPALRRQLEQALLGVTNDVSNIQREGASKAQAAAQDAARAQRDADRDLLDLLAARREDVERAGERAEAEGNLARAIRFEDRFQALVKQQIQKIREQISDQKTRKDVIRELRIAVQQSRLEEDALRRERAEEAAATTRTGIELDIELADINENTRRRIALREKLIRQLILERKKLRLTGNALKENRNEIARIRQEIEEITKEGKKAGEAGRSFQELTFEFLQTQQGFAANLLGNLIPGFATAGLVGNVSPGAQGLAAPQFALGAGIQQEAAVSEARDIGFSRGQGNTTNELLRRILRALEHLNGRAAAPEARYQKATQSAFMDVIGT